MWVLFPLPALGLLPPLHLQVFHRLPYALSSYISRFRVVVRSFFRYLMSLSPFLFFIKLLIFRACITHYITLKRNYRKRLTPLLALLFTPVRRSSYHPFVWTIRVHTVHRSYFPHKNHSRGCVNVIASFYVYYPGVRVVFIPKSFRVLPRLRFQSMRYPMMEESSTI